MKNEQSVRRLRPAGGAPDTGALRDTFTALIHEAHRQQKHRSRSNRDEPVGFPHPTASSSPISFSPMLPDNLQSLLWETTPKRRAKDLILPKAVRHEVMDLVAEISEAALLRSHSLEPRHTVMLVGPPGTGKTSLAGALAKELALPFLTVRYDGLVGSYLGETAGRLAQIVEYVQRTPCVLFFDEFDSVGKERSDAHETGEIKRVVSSLLLHMDALPSHCVVVCATNHPELLDRAVWRRFEVRIELPKPGDAELRDWYIRVHDTFGEIGISAADFTRMFRGETFSEVETVVLDARRKHVLSKGSKTSVDAFKEAVMQWERRRKVGGTTQVGAGTNRKNRTRARPTSENTGPTSEVSSEDLLRDTG
ncbi:AAA family ATPase [Sphingomonas sanguinis]|uniref:AAA family ATPase n=1 Tax=Sphingomonas sanguinis TaxID=33051 RepID=A0A7Y7QXK2_9SPHN|nr:ATP-binding protein [Sphingomonas sanguinis]MBZ6383232.1 ATP-binding protein [Sphingomonas sanguinis]NNG50092.1 AAA family ATPase [Sphingomonas sanguinis]NNG53571.1 AAA family ATPase [Sphingomonas sanguinis]NVP32527.1 AAA family ATPase [Sphingomonas sanguinis]